MHLMSSSNLKIPQRPQAAFNSYKVKHDTSTLKEMAPTGQLSMVGMILGNEGVQERHGGIMGIPSNTQTFLLFQKFCLGYTWAYMQDTASF